MNWLDILMGVKDTPPVDKQGIPTWNTDIAKRKRQQALVDALRQKAAEPTPEGSIKGGGGGGDIFGPRPGIYSGGANWGTALAQTLGGGLAGYRQDGLDAQEAAQEQAMKADRQRWLDQMYPEEARQAPAPAPMPMPGPVHPSASAADVEVLPLEQPPKPIGSPLGPMSGGRGRQPLAPQMPSPNWDAEYVTGALGQEPPTPLGALGELPSLTPSDVPGQGVVSSPLTATAPILPTSEATQSLIGEADQQIARNASLLKRSVAAQTPPSQPATEPDPMLEHRRMMRWAGQGMDNPLSQPMAQDVWKSGVDFPEKRTLATERQAAISADRLRTLEAAAQRLDLQLADKALDRAQRAMLQEQRLTLQAAIANETNRVRMAGYQLQASVLPYTISLKQAQIDEKKRGKPLGDKDKEILSVTASTATGLGNLLSTFKDDFAGWGAAGPAVRTGGNILGSWAPEKIQAMDNWWAEFEMLAELPMRHEMFGAALTATEKQAWSNAQRVRANKDPKQVRAALQQMVDIANRKGAKFREALAAEGKNVEAIDALLGGPDLNADTDRIEVRRGKRRSDGATIIEYSDNTREVIPNAR